MRVLISRGISTKLTFDMIDDAIADSGYGVSDVVSDESVAIQWAKLHGIPAECSKLWTGRKIINYVDAQLLIGAVVCKYWAGLIQTKGVPIHVYNPIRQPAAA